MDGKEKPAPWEQGTCTAPMWMNGLPAGLCGQLAYGHKLPSKYLRETRGHDDFPFCSGHACPAHGGPNKNEVRLFKDGYTDDGRPMWCAVLPGFVNVVEHPVGFDVDPIRAVTKLRDQMLRESDDE